MENLFGKMKSINNESGNRSFPFFFIKSTKDETLKSRSQMSVLGRDVKKRFKCLKKKVHGNGVFKKFLSPREKNKSSTIIKYKWSDKIGKDSGTSRDSGLEGMSDASSISSLVITGNFCTSSPVSERKLNQFSFPDDLQIETFQLDDNNIDGDKKVNNTQVNNNKSENVDKYTTTQLLSGNLIRSKSDSELYSELDCDDVAEKIREITRDDPLRQSYPGMSNTTRRETCHQLLKILLAQIDTNQHNKDEDTVDSEIIDDTFGTFDSDYINNSNSVDTASTRMKSLPNIPARPMSNEDESHQQNPSHEEQTNIVHNELNISKLKVTTPDDYPDYINKVIKCIESRKIVENNDFVVELNWS